METRFRKQVQEKSGLVPPEVWQLIVSFLTPYEAVRAALVCSEFAAISTPAAQQSCRRLWPQHQERLGASGSFDVQRFLRLVQAHEDEVAAQPDIEKAKSVQKTVCPEHRQIAVEWLIEVSWDWQLESTVVYRGTQYLDRYLATHAVPALGKFQMLAISCLRTALKHSNKLAERERQRLPCKHWAEVTDGACTEAEVRNTCLKLERMLHQGQRSHPNAKQRLRFLWYRLFDAGIVKQEHVYIYMLASFLLHLSLLDSILSAITPTKLACAALSLSLKVFGFPPMPNILAHHCFYLESELKEVQIELGRAQEEVLGSQLRALWVQSYSYSAPNASAQPAYTLLQQIVTDCCKLSYLPTIEASGNKQEAQAEGVAAAEGAPEAPKAAAAAPAAAQGSTAAVAETDAAEEALVAAAPASAPSAVHRVMTRAAAAAGLASTQRQQQQHTPPSVPAAAAASTSTPGDRAQGRSALGHGQASSSKIAAVPSANPDADQGAALATPQRPAAVSTGHVVPPMGPLPDFSGLGAAAAAATPPSAPSAAAGHPEAHSGLQQPPSTGGAASARRELPPRRAVAVSRYGMLASRGSNGTPARGALAPAAAAEGPPSSRAASAAGMVAVAQQRSGAGSSSGVCTTAPGAAVATATAAGPSGMRADSAGPSSSYAGAVATAILPPAGSMTPASPKHAAAGMRGLAALFANVGSGGAGSSSQAGTGSNTGRLLSGLPSLQHKSNLGDTADLQRLPEESSWLWAVHHNETGSTGKHGTSSKAGTSSMLSVPVLRSARRAAAASSGSGSPHPDLLQKVHERQGVHTRSSSGGGSCDGSSSQWHPAQSTAPRSHHHPIHD